MLGKKICRAALASQPGEQRKSKAMVTPTEIETARTRPLKEKVLSRVMQDVAALDSQKAKAKAKSKKAKGAAKARWNANAYADAQSQ